MTCFLNQKDCTFLFIIVNDINNEVVKGSRWRMTNINWWNKKLTSFDTSKTPSWIFLYMVPAVFMKACKRIGYIKTSLHRQFSQIFNLRTQLCTKSDFPCGRWEINEENKSIWCDFWPLQHSEQFLLRPPWRSTHAPLQTVHLLLCLQPVCEQDHTCFQSA